MSQGEEALPRDVIGPELGDAVKPQVWWIGTTSSPDHRRAIAVPATAGRSPYRHRPTVSDAVRSQDCPPAIARFRTFMLPVAH
jgi:hypothetical protein